MIRTRPMVPGGRNALVSILFQLKQMPGEDGKPGSELSPGEFRQALHELNILPPGLNLGDRASSRIRTRINLLIGDGQKPAMKPSEPGDTRDRLIMEDHTIAVRMLRDTMLDDAWETYGPQVQLALNRQIQFHRQFLANRAQHPDPFDNDISVLEERQTEAHLAAAEQDLETFEGEFNLTGVT